MKTRKQFLPAPILALLAAALIFAAGCSDGSGGGSGDNDTITAATAETITASALEGTKWSYTDGDYTRTIEFQSSGNVTIRDVDSNGSSSDNYTYRVDGSTVTIYDRGEKWG